MSDSPRPVPTVGWREWVRLPELGVAWIKAKIDTGARSSSLHAFDLESFERDGEPWVRFVVHPWQASDSDPVTVEAPLHDSRSVRSSSGESEIRPVIRALVDFGEFQREADITLTNRDAMGFRMLIGREAMRLGMTVSPASSYLTGRPPLTVRRQNRDSPEDA